MPPGRPLLSAAMIVRDEEEHLGACLDSLRGVVDEIVVVDTGSVDDSVAIAEAHGAQVYREGWFEDFARARNAALDRAKGRWILYIDADERLRPITRAEVVALLEPAQEIAFRVLLRPFVGSTPCREFRLWRNDPRIRFEGVIHEKVVPAIQAVARADARQIGLCDLALDHVGYEGDQTRKHLRNLPLLRAQLAAEPRNVFNWRHLAAVLIALGEVEEAGEALERAVELVRDGDAPTSGVLAYIDLIRFRHPRGGAGELFDEAISRYPHDPLLIWTKAIMELDAADPRSALAWLDRLDALDPARLDDTIGYDDRLFGLFAHQTRALAWFRLGQFEDAALAYGAAERCEPGNEEHRIKRLMAEHLADADRTVASSRVLDLADFLIRFDSSDTARDNAVDAVVGALPRHDGEPPVFGITFDARAPSLPSEAHHHADGAIRAWWIRDDLFLGHGGLAARVDSTTAHIGGEEDLARGFRQLLPYVVTHLLAPHDRFVLHGGAIQRGDRAVLVLGGTGAGKSTVVGSAAGSGWGALADDLVVVRLGPGGPEVTGIAKPLAVPHDVVEATRLPARPMAGDPRGRWQLAIAVPRAAWYPITTTVVSAHGDTTDGELRLLTSQELFEWLLFSFLSRHERTRLRRFLPVAAALTGQRGWELRHGLEVSTRVTQVNELLSRLLVAQEGLS